MSRREVWQPPPNSPVLIVSRVPEDSAALRGILESEKWLVQEAADRARALSLLQQTHFPVLICQEELGRADWRDLLRMSQLMPFPPQFIVSSRVADYQLWAEALNLGAWDVIGAPLVPVEVLRVVGLASQRWLRLRHVKDASAPTSEFSLSFLEEELLHLVKWGLREEDIAEELGIPSHEASRRLAELCRKVGVSDLLGLALLAPHMVRSLVSASLSQADRVA